MNREEAVKAAGDVMIVLSMWDVHPIPEGDAAEELIASQVEQMSREESFRSLVASLSDETQQGAVRNLLRRGTAASLRAARNLCAASSVIQNEAAKSLEWDVADCNALVWQVASNACVGNAWASAEILRRANFSSVTEKTAGVIAAVLHTAGIWTDDKEMATATADAVLEDILKMYHRGRKTSQFDVWITSLIRKSQRSLEWGPGVASWAVQAAEHVAELACSEEENVRNQCRWMILNSSLFADIHSALQDVDKCDDAAEVLRLLGNLLYAQPSDCGEALLREVGLIECVLSWSSFNPEKPLTREWALIVVRNATETSPAVHAYLDGMQVVSIADTPETQELERRTGRRLILENGKPKLV